MRLENSSASNLPVHRPSLSDLFWQHWSRCQEFQSVLSTVLSNPSGLAIIKEHEIGSDVFSQENGFPFTYLNLIQFAIRYVGRHGDRQPGGLLSSQARTISGAESDVSSRKTACG
jgi:hypothetical protein